MAKSEYIGFITCPHCQNENATVHEQASGNKKGRRYYRCYTEILGTVMRCGTIQSIGPEGQAYINKHMRPLEPIAQPEPEPVIEEATPIEPIGQPEPVEPEQDPVPEPIAQPEPTPTKKPLWDGMIRNLLVEE